MEKLTNVKALEFVLANCELPSEVAEKVSKMKAQFEKKASGSRKPTKTQIENEGLKADILTFLASTDKGVTITDMLKECKALEGLTNQKLTSLIHQLVDEKRVTRSMDKRKAVFSLASVEDVED